MTLIYWKYQTTTKSQEIISKLSFFCEGDSNFWIYVLQVSSLTHCPFSLIAKAGAVIDTDHLMETLPVAWELLLDEDQQLVSSVGMCYTPFRPTL